MSKNWILSQTKHVMAMLIATALVLFIIFINFVLLYKLEASERGAFGEMFGLSNTLFSGLGICGLIYTLIIQRITMGLHEDQARLSSISFRLQALGSAIESIEAQIRNQPKQQEKSQKIIELEKRRKKVGDEIEKIISELIDN